MDGISVALLVGCVAVGRCVGITLDGFAAGSLMPLLLEIVMVAVLLLAARSQTSCGLRPFV